MADNRSYPPKLPEADPPSSSPFTDIAVAPKTVRPVVNIDPGRPAGAIARDYKELEDAFGDLPLRFIRACRTLAERHGVRDKWEQLEERHEALRQHES